MLSHTWLWAIISYLILQIWEQSAVVYGLRKNWKYQKGKLRRSRKSKKDRQYSNQKKRGERTNNDLQNTTQKTKDRATRSPQKAGVNSCAPERWRDSSCSTCGTRRVTLVTNPMKMSLILWIRIVLCNYITIHNNNSSFKTQISKNGIDNNTTEANWSPGSGYKHDNMTSLNHNLVLNPSWYMNL